VHAVADRADVADPTRGRRHARQLRDQVRAADPDGHHAHARLRLPLARPQGHPDVPPGRGPAGRRREGPPVRRVASGLRADHAHDHRPRAAPGPGPGPPTRRARASGRGPAAGRRRPAGAVLPPPLVLEAPTADDTRAAGAALAPILAPRDVIVLTGEL